MSKQENKHSGEKNSHFGTCWITKDNKSIVIKKCIIPRFTLYYKSCYDISIAAKRFKFIN